MTKYNMATILIKISYFIKLQKVNDYKKVEIKTYQ